MKGYMTKMMFIFILLLCFSFTVSAQKNDEKKGERNPPTIVPDKDRQPKNDKDKNKDKDKKPEGIFRIIEARAEVKIS